MDFDPVISDAIIHSPGNRVRTQHKNNRRRKVKEKSTSSLITLERETPLKARQTRPAEREDEKNVKEVVSFTFTQDFNHEFVIVPRNFILYGLYSRLFSDGEPEEIEISEFFFHLAISFMTFSILLLQSFGKRGSDALLALS